MKIHNVNEDEFQTTAENAFNEIGIAVLDVSASQNEAGNIDYSFCLEVPKAMKEETLIKIFEYRSSVDFIH